MQHLASFSSLGLFVCAAILTAVPVTVNAGEMEATYAVPAEATTSRSSLIDPISGVVSVGYDSTYMFRGSNLGKNAPWAEVDFSAPVGAFTIDGGAWYVNPTDPAGGVLSPNNDELDLYLRATTTVSVLDLWIGYTGYLYPESGRNSTNEVGVGFGASINFVDISFGYYHDFDLNTNYYEWAVGKNIDLNEFIALNMGLALGHVGTRNFHGVISTGLDFALTDALTLSTYIAYNFVDAERPATGFEDRFFGGVSVSASF